MKLFENFTPIENPKRIVTKQVKQKGKYKGIIRVHTSTYSTDDREGKFKKGDEFTSVGFEGHDEGSGSPCNSEEEAQKHIEYLKEKHKDNYRLEIIDER